MKKYIFLLFILSATCAYAQVNTSTNIGWTPPATYEDGRTIDQPIKYRVYICESTIKDDKTCDKALSTYDTPADVDQYNVKHQTESNAGTLHIRLSAISMNDDLESKLSNEIQQDFAVPSPPKAPVINVSVTVIQN